MTAHPRLPAKRWRFRGLRRLLRPANRIPLDAWVTKQGRGLGGRVLNVGAGEDIRRFGARTIRLDAHAPDTDVRADLAWRLPFLDHSFDAALCTEVLEHVSEPAHVLREIARVLKPGAVAIVTVPFFFHYHPDPEDYGRFTPVGLRVALEHAGFEVDFLAGVGGKVIAALLLVESVHMVSKVLVRTLLVPFRPLLVARAPVHGLWSDCAANVAAVARRRRDANP